MSTKTVSSSSSSEACDSNPTAPSAFDDVEPPGGSSVTTVGIVPARGGSKRIPGKNINDFHGRPLITHTISTMIDAAIFDRIVVTTDDEQIAEVARSSGAEVPFLRPSNISGDHTGTGVVVRHAISELEKSGPLDEVCLVYPAAVFTEAHDLIVALEELRLDPLLEYVFAATTFPAPIERALVVDDDGFAQMVQPDHLLTRSQDLVEHFHDVGQFYWGRRDAWMEEVPVMSGRSKLHVIPRWRVQDIDTPEDWTRAELLYDLIARSGR